MKKKNVYFVMILVWPLLIHASSARAAILGKCYNAQGAWTRGHSPVLVDLSKAKPILQIDQNGTQFEISWIKSSDHFSAAYIENPGVQNSVWAEFQPRQVNARSLYISLAMFPVEGTHGEALVYAELTCAGAFDGEPSSSKCAADDLDSDMTVCDRAVLLK